MEMTKGYFRAKGLIWSLDNKEAYTNSAVRSLSFGIQTDKDNTIFVQVGEWKNTSMNIKLKGGDMTEVETVNEQDSIGRIKELFKDGDSVFLNLRAEVDTYNHKLKYLVNQIYVENEPIDFESKDFIETNELNTPVVIIAPAADKKITVGMVNFKQEMLEVELSLSDSDVNTYFTETVKVGDLVKVSIQVNRRPNYVEPEEVVEEPIEEVKDETRKTLKGKTIGGDAGKKSNKKKRSIDGYIESMEIIDVDTDKTEKGKYTLEEIDGVNEQPEQFDDTQIPF